MKDSSSIKKNPVRRTIAKLFLNCLWGKFAQRLQLPKTRYLTGQDELNKMLEDSTIAMKGMELLTNPDHPESDMILVNYEERQEFIEECPFGKGGVASIYHRSCSTTFVRDIATLRFPCAVFRYRQYHISTRGRSIQSYHR